MVLQIDGRGCMYHHIGGTLDIGRRNLVETKIFRTDVTIDDINSRIVAECGSHVSRQGIPPNLVQSANRRRSALIVQSPSVSTYVRPPRQSRIRLGHCVEVMIWQTSAVPRNPEAPVKKSLSSAKMLLNMVTMLPQNRFQSLKEDRLSGLAMRYNSKGQREVIVSRRVLSIGLRDLVH